MLDDLHLAGMADRTIYGYIRAVRQLAEFSQLAPDQLTEEHVQQRSRRTYAPPPLTALQTIKLPTV